MAQQNAALLTPNRLADRLGISPRTLQDWRSRKVGPPWIRVGRVIRYREEDVNEWIEKRTEEGQA
jgi:excisionase family DNA binding protein